MLSRIYSFSIDECSMTISDDYAIFWNTLDGENLFTSYIYMQADEVFDLPQLTEAETTFDHVLTVLTVADYID